MKSILRKTVFLLSITVIVFISFGFLGTVNATDSETIPVDVNLWIRITNFDQSKKMVEYELSVFVEGIGDNKSEISIGIPGWTIPCEPQKMENGWRYYCKFDPVSVKVSGEGETFPFDKYTLTIPVSLSTSLFSFDHNVYVYDLSNGTHSIYFSGTESESLGGNWKTHNGRDLLVRTTNDTVSIDFIRNEEKVFLYFLQFIAPIAACYYLMGASLILNPEALAERLRIYFAVFFFVPTYMIAIQVFLPYRNFLSFPEFLLINLLFSTAILCVFSVIANRRLLDLPKLRNLYKSDDNPRIWENIGIVIALFSFSVLYYSTLFGIVNIAIGLLLAYFILPAYLMGSLFRRLTPLQFKERKKSISLFIFLLLPIAIIYELAFTLSSYFLTILLAGSCLMGIIVGLKCRNPHRNLILIGSYIFVSLILGLLVPYFVGGGLDGLLYWGSMFIIFGTVGWLFAFLCARIIDLIMYLRRERGTKKKKPEFFLETRDY